MKNFLQLFLVSISTLCGWEKVHYCVSTERIDVVIPCVDKDLSRLELCIAGILKNGVNVGRVIVVSPNRLTDKAEWFDESRFPFTKEEMLTRCDRETADYLRSHGRVGWVYQQLLKLYAPIIIPEISSNVLILDADTIFLRPVRFVNTLGEGLYNVGKEHHRPYFVHMEEVIPGLKKQFRWYSGVTHHMLFQRAVIEDLFAVMRIKHQGLEPWEIFCKYLQPTLSPMSEYEIYFNFLFARSDQAHIRRLKWKDERNLTDFSLSARKGFDYISVHERDLLF